MDVMQEDEQRERNLLDRIAITMHDCLNWTSSPGALPSPNLPEGCISGPLITTAQNALYQEQVDARTARKLAEGFSAINGGLDSQLLESAARHGETHVQLLRFVLQRLLSRSAKQRLSDDEQKRPRAAAPTELTINWSRNNRGQERCVMSTMPRSTTGRCLRQWLHPVVAAACTRTARAATARPWRCC